MNFLIFIIIFYILLSVSLYKVFEKAGVEPKKALIPGVNFVEWCKLIGRKPTHALWLLFPIVNIFILTGMSVDLVRSFKNYDFKWAAIAVAFPPLAFFLLGKNEDKYDAPTLIKEKEYFDKVQAAKESDDKYKLKKLLANNPYKKSEAREWVESVVFAVFAAAFIRMFLIEPYVIPTPSMEGSLLVGDFLFVSKAHYGIRPPMTIAMFPLLHNTVPFLGTESYLKKPSLEYNRLPAITPIDNNDPIVFNYPEGDSVYITPGRVFSVHDVRRNPSIAGRVRGKTLRVRPVDKRDHYVKRCIAKAGDKLEIKDRQVYINDQPAVNPTNLQFQYIVTTPTPLSEKRLNEWNISTDPSIGDVYKMQNNQMILVMSEEQKKKVQSISPDITIKPIPNRPNPKGMFPHDPQITANWSVDNYGPITIPAAGVTVQLRKDNIALYRRAIKIYENNELEEKGGKFFINGKEATSYTFKQNYYWAMGDNRHNSEDSRAWGYVPEDHIVGKPLFIWFSMKDNQFSKGINWSRLFSSAQKM